jgi:hypothetical protein
LILGRGDILNFGGSLITVTVNYNGRLAGAPSNIFTSKVCSPTSLKSIGAKSILLKSMARVFITGFKPGGLEESSATEAYL